MYMGSPNSRSAASQDSQPDAAWQQQHMCRHSPAYPELQPFSVAGEMRLQGLSAQCDVHCFDIWVCSRPTEPKLKMRQLKVKLHGRGSLSSSTKQVLVLSVPA